MTEWAGLPRQAGKSSRVIAWAQEEHPQGPLRYVVCHSFAEANRLFHASMDENGDPSIRFPLTIGEAMRYSGRPALFAVDDADVILREMFRAPIALATFTVEAELQW